MLCAPAKRTTTLRVQYEKLLPIGLKGYGIIITIVRSAAAVTHRLRDREKCDRARGVGGMRDRERRPVVYAIDMYKIYIFITIEYKNKEYIWFGTQITDQLGVLFHIIRRKNGVYWRPTPTVQCLIILCKYTHERRRQQMSRRRGQRMRRRRSH